MSEQLPTRPECLWLNKQAAHCQTLLAGFNTGTDRENSAPEVRQSQEGEVWEMNAQDIANALNNSQYPMEIPKEIKAQAKAAGIVIVYGASDDLMEFAGAIYDEMGCYDGGTAYVDAKGLLDRGQIDDDSDEEIADYVIRKKTASTIEAIWSDEGSYSWTYKTDIPHVTFEIKEDDEPYCRGIVFNLSDLPQ